MITAIATIGVLVNLSLPTPTIPEPAVPDFKPVEAVTLPVETIEAPKFEKAEALKVIPTSNPKPAGRAVQSSGRTQAPAGWYPAGQCTHYVWTKRQVGKWHDAGTWPAMARAEGYYVGPKPIAGAIGQKGNHVVYVEAVYKDTVLISEQNYDYNGSFRRIERPISYFDNYIY